MLHALCHLLSSARRVRLHCRAKKRRITPPDDGAIAIAPLIFSSGGGGDGIGPLVKPAKKTLRKLKEMAKTSCGRRHGYGRHDGKVQDAADEQEQCVWRRTILLGQRCQPLVFSGVIHYDSEGKRVWQARMPPGTPPLSPACSVDRLGYVNRA